MPSWETAARSLCGTMQSAELKQNSTSMVDGSKGKEVSVSARKLGATLWGINQVPSKKKDMEMNKEPKQARRSGERSAKLPSQSASLPPRLSDPSYTPFSEVDFLSYPLHLKMVGTFSFYCTARQMSFVQENYYL